MKNPQLRQARSEPFSLSQRQSLKRRAAGLVRPRPMRHRPPAATIGVARAARLRPMLHATFSPAPSAAMSPSPFSALLFVTRRLSAAQGAPS
jgi:hypothetical protein